MTTQLALYNEALTDHLGERKLASLAEDREPRRVLDEIWDAGAVQYVLEEGNWKFAQRTALLTVNPAITPSFGYVNGFNKPTDLVKLTRVCSDERLENALLNYAEEGAFYFADLDTIAVAYISNHVDYGLNLAGWPQTFVRCVAAYLAMRACNRITQSRVSKDDLEATYYRLLKDARSKDALQGPTRFMPMGSWNRSRSADPRGGDRGNRGSLIG